MIPAISSVINSFASQPKLETIFDKSRQALMKEYYDTPEHYDSAAPNPIFSNGLTYSSAHHCLNETLIIIGNPSRVELFLNMLYEKTDVVVNLIHGSNFRPATYHHDTKPFENGEYTSCLKNDMEEPFSEIKKSTLQIEKKDGETKNIQYYHVVNWNDNAGIAPESAAFIARVLLNTKRGLVHCSAGIGRSGTIASIILAYQMITAGDTAPDVIARAVQSVREQRPNLHHDNCSFCVNTFPQYETIYGAVKLLLKEDKLI